MLRIYRRHRSSCSHTSERYRRCSCPIYVEGTLGGETIRRALDQTNWEAASELVSKWTRAARSALRASTSRPSGRRHKYFEDAIARQLQPGTISKHTNLLKKRLLPWCNDKGYQQLKQLDVDALRQFRATWPDGPLSAYKNPSGSERSLVLSPAGWIEKNHASGLKPPKLPDKSKKVKVFTPEQIKKMLEACDKYPERNSYGHDNRARVKALILVLRYSGMRIGDCVGFGTRTWMETCLETPRRRQKLTVVAADE